MLNRSSFPNLNFDKILQDAKQFSLPESDSYIQSYPEFLKYFERIKGGDINEHDLIIASHFVYGWMPTILRLDLNKKTQVLKYLNAVKSGRLLDEEELNILKVSINNSMVGLSKLLHFINPENYAIWDSKVYRYATSYKSDFGITNVSLYLEYLERIKAIAANENYRKIHELVSKNFDYEIYPTRAIEIVMFKASERK
ncbi:hypothetical protein [Mangrovimonas futianensis]|uniref:hypothetical protein n=1 Tax=Mangrovimonas futianensis TaxID=2895523 RepID=UPI001E31DD1E|nr:hypothetical protein [Mangrovimonas futianensis]MCF1420433.1 hypothetical protein [Mangrovimonas futianensis]